MAETIENPKLNEIKLFYMDMPIFFSDILYLFNIKEIMKEKGFKEAPKLEVGDVVYGFKEAVDWIKEQ